MSARSGNELDCGLDRGLHGDCSDACAHDVAANSAADAGYDAGRRDFLRDGLMAVAAIAAVAGAAAPLEALTREYVVGLSALGTVSYPLPTADGAMIDRTNKLILVRYRGMVHAFNLECPHRGTMVQWEPQNDRFYCPKHKSTFQPEGTRIQGKAPRGLDRYAVRIEAGKVVVDTAVVFDQEKDAAGWTGAGVKVA